MPFSPACCSLCSLAKNLPLATFINASPLLEEPNRLYTFCIEFFCLSSRVQVTLAKCCALSLDRYLFCQRSTSSPAKRHIWLYYIDEPLFLFVAFVLAVIICKYNLIIIIESIKSTTILGMNPHFRLCFFVFDIAISDNAIVIYLFSTHFRFVVGW